MGSSSEVSSSTGGRSFIYGLEAASKKVSASRSSRWGWHRYGRGSIYQGNKGIGPGHDIHELPGERQSGGLAGEDETGLGDGGGKDDDKADAVKLGQVRK